MPSLTLFGQKTPVAGDDLRTYSFFFLLMRMFQFGASLALLIHTSDVLTKQDTFFQFVNNTTNPQEHASLFRQLEDEVRTCMEEQGEGEVTRDRVVRMNQAYLVLSLILATAGILFANIICQVSSCGTPTNGQITMALAGSADRQRQRVLQFFCHIHLTVLVAIRLAVAVLGFVVYSEVNALCGCSLDIDFNTTVIEWNLQHADITPAIYDEDVDYGCGGTFHELYYFLIIAHIVELVCNGVVITFVTSKALCSTKGFEIISKKLFIPRTLGSEGQWRLFCQCCCTLTSVASCCVLGGKEAALGDFTEIAMLLGDYFNFHGVLDVTPTDMVAALLLLGEVQTQRIHDARRHILEKTKEYKSEKYLSNWMMDENEEDEKEPFGPDSNRTGKSTDSNNSTMARPSMRRVIKKVKSSNNFQGINYRLKHYEGAEWKWEAHITKVLDPDDAMDVLAIAEGVRFMRLSMAIYTWVMYSFNRPCTGCCTICCVSIGRNCHGERPEQTYYGDGPCCRLHSTAFMREAGIDDETEIAYAYFYSGLVEAPHAVVLDHEWKSVVIVIRGTLSLEDILTDLTIKPTNLEEVGKRYGFDGSEFYVHGGMLATSEWILKGLREQRILDKLFASASPYSSYQLRITGHSLGAGVAAILSMLLRPVYPNLKCHSFCPPGCTMSENAAKESEEYTTAYIKDADIVPRASLHSLDNLRLDLVDVISRIKVPKYDVMDEFTGCGLGRTKDKSTIVDRLLYKEDETPRSKFRDMWREYRKRYDAKKATRGSHAIELFPPGKLIQLFPSNGIEDDLILAKSCPLSCCSKKAERPFSSRWANRQDFREIRISSHFVDDHIPGGVLQRLEEEAERFGLASPYLVEVESESQSIVELVEENPPIINVQSIFVGVADDMDEGEGMEISY